jgi:triosephosphate isomerase
MKKKFYLGTNWKMHLTNSDARRYISELAAQVNAGGKHNFTLFVIPSFLSLQLVRDAITATGVDLKLGAQNVHWESADESTGEVSVRMLKDVPVDLIEIGHSERRRKFGETDEIVNRKLRAVIDQDLSALLCIGEELDEKQQDDGKAKLERQIREGLRDVSAADSTKLILAYEPVWAIGPHGEPATTAYVSQQHRFIREILIDLFGAEAAVRIPIIYGGSVNHQNCASYASLDHVDGLFVGRTAWEAGSFARMIRSLKALEIAC